MTDGEIATDDSSSSNWRRDLHIAASTRISAVTTCATKMSASAAAFELAAVDPAAVDPAAVDPAAVDPAAVDPAAVDPAAVDPEAVDPEAVDPEAVDPEAVDPEAVDPEVLYRSRARRRPTRDRARAQPYARPPLDSRAAGARTR
jgi:hypothetical protein